MTNPHDPVPQPPVESQVLPTSVAASVPASRAVPPIAGPTSTALAAAGSSAADGQGDGGAPVVKVAPFGPGEVPVLAERLPAGQLPVGSKAECPNCGEFKPDSDAFCRRCGQRHTNLNDGLGVFLSDFFASFLSVDGRAFRTVTTLLLWPGLAAVDFLQGKRARYLSSAQTYLVSGFLFFVVFGQWVALPDLGFQWPQTVSDANQHWSEVIEKEMGQLQLPEPTQEVTDDPADGPTPTTAVEPQDASVIDEASGSEKNELEQDKTEPQVAPYYRVYTIKLNGRPLAISLAQFREFAMMSEAGVDEFFSKQEFQFSGWQIRLFKKLALLTTDFGLVNYISNSIAMASQVALLMLPMMAVLLRLFHWRSCPTWLAAFVVSAHWHAGVYLSFSLLMLVNLSVGWVCLLGGAMGLFLWFGTLRRVFHQHWAIILIKSVFILPAYGLGVLLAATLAVAGSLFLT